MGRRKFLGGAAAGVVAGAATTVGGGESQAQTKSDATKPDADSPYHSHEGGSLSHSLLPSDPALRVKAMETLLLEKGLIDAAAVDAMIDQYENKLGPKIGAAVVAKAWGDSAFKKSLMEDAAKALTSIGITGNGAEQMIAVENTDEVHNVVVCTLCSCYPWAVLGLPPAWYKSEAYRSRVVREPRKVLAEFGGQAARTGKGPRLGFELRDALPRRAAAPQGYRDDERGAACGPRHPRFDDRHRHPGSLGRRTL